MKHIKRFEQKEYEKLSLFSDKKIEEFDKFQFKKFLVIDTQLEVYISIVRFIDKKTIHLTSFYTFNKNTLKLKKNTTEQTINKKDINIIFQSDNPKECLEKINELYGKIEYKYKKYIVANTQKRVSSESYGIFEVQRADKEWEKLYRKSPIVKLIIEAYNSKIFQTIWNKIQSLAAYKIDDNHILYQTDSFDDAYEYLETLLNAEKYNL